MTGGLLLDTHAVLWYFDDSRKMPESVYAQIDDPGVAVLVSAASLWEIAIKSGLGKLNVGGDLPERIAASGFETLDVTPAHAWHVRELPQYHRDPFDRILIAQAQMESLRLVTRDPVFASYDGLDVAW